MWYVLALAAVLAAAGAALPSDLASVVVELAGACGMIALWRGSRANHAPFLLPFKLVVAGGSSFLIGNIVRTIHGTLVGLDAPFPSPADVLYFIGYGCIVAGFALLVRRRSADIEGDNLLDALLFAV